MRWSGYVLGYHGCDAEIANKIVSGRDTLNPSANDYDWLGHGQYFWEESVARALRWATEESRSPSRRIKQPTILGAVIDMGECLNLTKVENIQLVQDAHRRLQNLMAESGEPMPRNTGRGLGARNLDCAVFEMLHLSRQKEVLPSFDTVRAFFIEGEPLYPTSGIRQLDHVQICVRNPASIIGYFLPRNI
jgi:hypothetical protein